MGSPGDEGGGEGLGYLLLVGGIGDGKGFGGAVGEWCQFDGDGWAGEIVEGADGGFAKDEREFGAIEDEAELVDEAEALGNGGGLGGVPGEGTRCSGTRVE